MTVVKVFYRDDQESRALARPVESVEFLFTFGRSVTPAPDDRGPVLPRGRGVLTD